MNELIRDSLWTRLRRRFLADLAYLRLLFIPAKTLSGKRFKFRRHYGSGILRAVSQMDLYEVGHNPLMAYLLANKDGAFIDAGANVGQTLLKLLSTDPSRSYIGFEPQISAAANIDYFIKDNALKDHMILPVGLSNETGVVKFGVRFPDDTAASSNLDFRPSDIYAYFSSVVVFSGDELIQRLKIEDVSIIKIDVEGAEFQVMKGFTKTLSKHEPFVIFECLPEILRSNFERLSDEVIAVRNKAYADIVEFLHSKKYSIFLVHDNGTQTRVHSIIADRSEVMNFVAVPSSFDLEGFSIAN